MKFILPLLVALICSGCSKPEATTAQVDPPITRWEFQDFNYNADAFVDGTTNYMTVCYLGIQTNMMFGLSDPWDISNRCYNLSSVLNQLGAFGWDLSSSESNHYILKRESHGWQPGHFYVGETVLKLSNAK